MRTGQGPAEIHHRALGVEDLHLGVVLADVHWQNVGRSMPGGPWVITDPGHAVVVNPDVAIPPIEAI